MKILRKVYGKIVAPVDHGNRIWPTILRGQQAGDCIRRALESPDSTMICRIGPVELDCLASYVCIKNNKNSL